MSTKKIADILDGFYNDHLVNGATLFGVFLALYAVSQLPDFKGKLVIYWAMIAFFYLSLYEIIIKGVLVRILRKL